MFHIPWDEQSGEFNITRMSVVIIFVVVIIITVFFTQEISLSFKTLFQEGLAKFLQEGAMLSCVTPIE